MAASSLTQQFLADPTDINFGDNVHGGIAMKWIDQAAMRAPRNRVNAIA